MVKTSNNNMDCMPDHVFKKLLNTFSDCFQSKAVFDLPKILCFHSRCTVFWEKNCAFVRALESARWQAFWIAFADCQHDRGHRSRVTAGASWARQGSSEDLQCEVGQGSFPDMLGLMPSGAVETVGPGDSGHRSPLKALDKNQLAGTSRIACVEYRIHKVANATGARRGRENDTGKNRILMIPRTVVNGTVTLTFLRRRASHSGLMSWAILDMTWQPPMRMMSGCCIGCWRGIGLRTWQETSQRYDWWGTSVPVARHQSQGH